MFNTWTLRVSLNCLITIRVKGDGEGDAGLDHSIRK
jgi:hypothetical protein